ncbi:TPR-like protein [Apiospora arundinis]|uniref:TPR-like protein n=1 Tax=Apiospora arundinis TaxID=335852 RepID=A0ABR2IWA6_9PEZI
MHLPQDSLRSMIHVLWDSGLQEVVGKSLQTLIIRRWADGEQDVGRTVCQIVLDLRDDDGDTGELLSELAMFALGEYERTGSGFKIDTAIEIAKLGKERTPDDHPNRFSILSNLGTMLMKRYDKTRDENTLEAAIIEGEMAGAVLNNLAGMLQRKYESSNSITDLEAAISTMKKAISTAPEQHLDRIRWVGNLAPFLAYRFEQLQHPEDLRTAIVGAETAVNALDANHPEMARRLTTLAMLLHTQAERTRDLKDWEMAVERAKSALSATPNDRAERPQRLTNLGSVLLSRYLLTLKTEDLESAIKLARSALLITPEGDPDRSKRMINLGRALLSRYERTGDKASFEEAFAMAEAVPKQQRYRTQAQRLLGDLLFRRYERTGSRADMERAVAMADTAVLETPDGHDEMPDRLSNLAYKLRGQYERTGNISYLEIAIANARRAVALTPKGHTDRAGWQNNVASTVFRRYERTKSDEDLEEAIASAEQAISGTPADHPDRVRYLSNLGPMLSCRYRRTNSMVDLEAAIDAAEKTVEGAPEDLPNRAMWLSNLASVYHTRYERTRSAGDLEAAMSKAKMAVAATPTDHPDRASWLFNLAALHMDQLERTQNPDDYHAAIGRYQESFECTNSPALVRVQAAHTASRMLWLLGPDFLVQAASLATRAVELIPAVCTRYLNREDQQNAIVQTSGLTTDCCSLLVQLGNPGKALQQLEFGRGVILGYLIDSRSDLSQLRRDHSGLADTYELLRLQVSRDMSTELGALRNSLLQERIAAAHSLEDCLRQIRAKTGYERFLLEPTLDELKAAAEDGFIAVVNIVEMGSHAITISNANGIAAVPLPISPLGHTGLESGPGMKWRAAIGDFIRGRSQGLPREVEVDEDMEEEERLSPFLSRLWTSCVKPVLDSLRGAELLRESRSRIWWIGTGMAASLPFHAAGQHHENADENTLAHAVSSYTPTVKALNFARSHVARSGERLSNKTSVLVVAMPETPQQNRLSGVLEETSAIRDAIRGLYQFESPERPTPVHVLDRMRESEIVHFACHGSSDAINPSDSHLLLHHSVEPDKADWLTVRQVSEIDLGRAWIAYLSACSTAETRADRLTDEALHLASAFLVAGFGHVISSMWSADDEISVLVARYFYRHLSAKRDTEAWSREANRAVAEALHNAVLHIRSDNPGEPHLWAPFIHYGA